MKEKCADDLWSEGIHNASAVSFFWSSWFRRPLTSLLLPAFLFSSCSVLVGVGFFHILMKWPTSFDAAPNNLSIDSTLCAQLHLLLWAACLSFTSGRNKKGGAVNSLPEEKMFRGNFFPFSTSLTYRSKLLHLYYSDCVCHDDDY